MSNKLTTEQISALAELVGELQLSPAVKTESEIDKTVANTIRPIRSTRKNVNYLDPKINSWDKWVQEGGASVCDDWKIKMAINSALILSATSLTITGGYKGYQTLDNFMKLSGFDKLTRDTISLLYEVSKVSGYAIYNAANVGVDIVIDAISDIPYKVKNVASSAIGSASVTVPLVALGRYTNTIYSARDDLSILLAQLESQHKELNNRIGVVTRSIANKKQKYAEEIKSLRQKLNEYKGHIEQAHNDVTKTYDTLFKQICDLLDKGASNIDAIQNIFNPYYNIKLDNLTGGKRYKKKHNTKRKIKRNAKKNKTYKPTILKRFINFIKK